ncbi:MAG: sigma-E factor regulatory protein RseB domain-containing protein [Candidatus Sericytochromatia bacterium]|nr:sigma-E factor regulatory protein RseB domain-containing protein [Candidatus Sericytochromatia bacterium]
MLFRTFAVGVSVLAGLFLVSPLAFAAPLTPESMLKAHAQTSYSGLLRVTDHRRSKSVNQRIRVTQAGVRRSRQEFLHPDGRISDLVIRDETIRWHHSTASHSVLVSPISPGFEPQQRLALLKQNYSFRVLGQLRHLKRLVLLAQFTPRHPGRLTHRLWVDQVERLPLVIERRGAQGQLIDRSEFLGVRFSPRIQPDALKFSLPLGARVQSIHTVLAQGGAQTPFPKVFTWRPLPPRQLPAGYQLLDWQYFLDRHSIPTVVWRYHDGLGLLSCFATASEHQARPPVAAKTITLGRFSAFEFGHEQRQVLMWRTDDTAYTMMGEVPPDALRTAAHSTY